MTPKFRAWIKSRQQMMEVVCIAYKYSDVGGLDYIISYVEAASDSSRKFTTSEPYFLDDFVLMQSTGVKDCNGKEIYEGDIIFGHTHEGPYYESDVVPKKVVVVWDSPTCSFRYRDLDLFFGTPQKPHTFLHEKEIVGNIYENPEYLPKDMAILNFLFNLKVKDYQEFLEKVHKND